MIIYGSNASLIANSKPTHIQCPQCQEHGTVEFEILSRYAHVFWIPFFPIGKKGVAVCSNCNFNPGKKEMNKAYSDEITNLKSISRPPIWHFTGLAVLLLAIVTGVYAVEQEKKSEVKLLQSIATGDIYEFKSEDGNFSSMKVNRVTTDSVYMLYNLYSINKRNHVYEINIDSNFTKEEFAYSKQEIVDLYETGEFIHIKRDAKN